MTLNKIKNVLIARWKYYLIGYIAIYIFFSLYHGDFSWQSLQPFKLYDIIIAFVIGNTIFHGIGNISILSNFYYAIKVILILMAILIPISIINIILFSTFGININPFLM